MNDQKDFVYRMRELIYHKYTEPKFAIGCELVAQWIRHATRNHIWDALRVQRMCIATIEEPVPLFKEEAEAIRQLFGLKTITEIFTIPETQFDHILEIK